MPQKPKSKSAAKDQNASMGFPTLEALLEQDKVDFSQMMERYKTLVDMSKKGKSAADKAAAKNSAAAYERFFDLFKSLTELKKKLQQDLVNKSKKK